MFVPSFGRVLTLDQLHTVMTFQRVVCMVKVLSMDIEMVVAGGLHKQDCVIGDATGTAKLTLWESEVNTVEEGLSYRLSGVVVREYRGVKSLSTSKDNSKIEGVEDIGEVCAVSGEEFDKTNIVENVRVGGVNMMENFNYACMSTKCNGKVVSDVEESDFGTCGRCGMMQCLEDCKKEASAQLLIKLDDGGSVPLQAFGRVLEDIAGGVVSKLALLKAKVFTMEHRDGVVRCISRKKE